MDGILNLLKPPGLTSNDAVVDVRRLFHEKRVGHTGTLDPGAAGVLPICLGKATRLFDYLVDKDKEYIAEVAFGAATDTLDSYGAVVQAAPAAVSAAEVAAVLPGLTGPQMQAPPLYSAVRHEGKKLYQMARRGQEVELQKKARAVTVYELELLEQTAENRFLLRMLCSKGTYVRVVCEDIGKRLGALAYTSFLMRTRAGPFRVENAVTLAEAKERLEAGDGAALLTPMEEALAFLPAAVFPEEALERLRNGNSLPSPAGMADAPRCRIHCGGLFVGVGQAEAGVVRVKALLM